MGFKQNDVRWAQIITSNITAQVMVNGDLTDMINIKRGVRQGCSYSMLLFLISLEPLINALNNDNGIPPIRVAHDTTIKTLAYADDITVTTNTEQGVLRTFQLIKHFEKSSGAKVNKAKCELYHTNPKVKTSHNDLKTIEVDQIRILGITLAHDIKTMITLNWDKTCLNIERYLRKFAWRDAQMLTRIEVTKSQVLPMIWYKARIIAPTKKQVKAIKRKIYSFVDPHAEILIDSMFLATEHGELGIPDIDIQVIALQTNRLNEIGPNKTWVKVAAPKIRMITRGTINKVNLNTLTTCVNTDPPYPTERSEKLRED